MGVIHDSIKSHGPRGRLKLHDAITGGIADALTDLRAAGRAVIDEAWPGTAVATLAQWHETLGIAHDPTARTDAEAQAMLAAMETSEGGSTLVALQSQLDKEFDGRVVVSEAYVIGVTGWARCGLARCGLSEPIIYTLGYDVTGTVYSQVEAARVASIIARYAPAHLEPNSLLTDLSASAIAICGLARAGVARCGVSA